MLRELTAGLQTKLVSARGPERIAAAADTVHAARLALEPLDGEDVQTVRELLAALCAAHREVGP
jgi:hypothetical protein